MKVLIVSGIWPPDVGGPASHAPEVAEMLLARGHEVEVVTTADRAPALEAYPVHWASRSLPRGVRHVRAVQLIAAAARRADVVYSTGMLGRSALGSALVHAPIVQKLTSDPTYERSIRYGLYGGDLDSFQRSGGWRVRAPSLGAEPRAAAHVPDPDPERVARRPRGRVGDPSGADRGAAEPGRASGVAGGP